MTASGSGLAETRLSDSSSSRVTTGWLLGRFGLALPWFVPIVFLVQMSLYLLIDGLDASMSTSFWEFSAENANYWFVFGMGASLAYTYFPLHVAQGGTRRSFVTAATVAVLVGGLIVALTVPLGYLIEFLIYGRYDWSQEFRTGHLFGNWRLGPLLLEYVLHYSLVGLLGTMVAGIYYRAGNLWGTALLPVTVLLPMALESQLLHGGSQGSGDSISLADSARQSLDWLNTESLPLALRVGLVAGILVLIVLVNNLVLRNVSLRTRQG